jgi:hypothetical protein
MRIDESAAAPEAVADSDPLILVDWENVRCAMYRAGRFPSPEALLEQIARVTAAACERRDGYECMAQDLELYLVPGLETWRFDHWLGQRPCVLNARIEFCPPWRSHFFRNQDFAMKYQGSRNKNMSDVEMILRALEMALFDEPLRRVVLVSSDSDVIRGAHFIYERLTRDGRSSKVAVLYCEKAAIPSSVDIDREDVKESLVKNLCWRTQRYAPTKENDVGAWVLRVLGWPHVSKEPPAAAAEWGTQGKQTWGIVHGCVTGAVKDPLTTLKLMSGVDTAIRSLFAENKFDRVRVDHARSVFEESGTTAQALEAAVMARLLVADWPDFVRVTPEWACGLSLPAVAGVLLVLQKSGLIDPDKEIEPGKETALRASAEARFVSGALRKPMSDPLHGKIWFSQVLDYEVRKGIAKESFERAQHALKVLGLIKIEERKQPRSRSPIRYWAIDLSRQPMNRALQGTAISVRQVVRTDRPSDEALLAFVEQFDPERRWFLDAKAFLDALQWGGVLHRTALGWAPSS